MHHACLTHTLSTTHWGVTGEMIARMYVIFLCSGSIEADDQEGNSPRILPRHLMAHIAHNMLFCIALSPLQQRH